MFSSFFVTKWARGTNKQKREEYAVNEFGPGNVPFNSVVQDWSSLEMNLIIRARLQPIQRHFLLIIELVRTRYSAPQIIVPSVFARLAPNNQTASKKTNLERAADSCIEF